MRVHRELGLFSSRVVAVPRPSREYLSVGTTPTAFTKPGFDRYISAWSKKRHSAGWFWSCAVARSRCGGLRTGEGLGTEREIQLNSHQIMSSHEDVFSILLDEVESVRISRTN